MSCGVSSRSAVVICSRCIQHAVPKHETSKWNSQISLSIVFSGSAGLKQHISDGKMFNWSFSLAGQPPSSGGQRRQHRHPSLCEYSYICQKLSPVTNLPGIFLCTLNDLNSCTFMISIKKDRLAYMVNMVTLNTKMIYMQISHQTQCFKTLISR